MTRDLHPRARRLPGVLLAAALVALALACVSCGSDPDMRQRYQAERMQWRVSRLERALSTNPELATDDMRRRIREAHTEIARRFPPLRGSQGAELPDDVRHLMRIAGSSRLALAAMASEDGDVATAAGLYASVRDSFAFDRALALDAALALAGSHEAGGSWEKAVEVYDDLLERWPPAPDPSAGPDLRILSVPIHVASVYAADGDSEEARERFERARDYFRHWIAEWPDGPTAAYSMNFAAESYLMEERWLDAAGALRDLDETYATDETRSAIWLRLGDLYSTRLDSSATAREYYTMVVENYRGELPAASGAIALAKLDIDSGDLESAREWLDFIVSDYGDEAPVAATALHHMALTYELEGQWENAVSYLTELSREYPTSIYGLAAPLHVAEHYIAMAEAAAADVALRRAAEHYELVVKDYPSTPAELLALSYLAETLLKQEKWNDAAEVLVRAAERFPDAESSPLSLLRAARLYETRIGDRRKAAGILEAVVRGYSGDPWAETAREQLEAMRGGG